MKNQLIIVGVAFAVALAYIIGSRLSNEALAVVVGAVCGISASIPVSIALVIASNNQWGKQDAPRDANAGCDYGAQRFVPQQPMVIFAPPQAMPGPYGAPSPYGFPYGQSQYLLPPSAPTMGAPREFKIIGEE